MSGATSASALLDEARDRSRDRRCDEKEEREEADGDHDLVVTASLGFRRAASATGTAALECTREAREGFTGDGSYVAGGLQRFSGA